MQRIEVQLVVTLLQFVQDPKNKHVFANLMRLLWGSTTEEILRNRIDYVFEHTNSDGEFDATNDNWQEDLEPVKDLLKQRERIQHLSIPEMVKAIIYESNIPSLTARWGDELVRRQNLSTLQHLADDYDQMCLQMGLGTSISGFIYYLNSIEPDKEKDNKSNTVKVFTYHGSKGLEWPIVIMHGLGENVLTDTDSGRYRWKRSLQPLCCRFFYASQSATNPLPWLQHRDWEQRTVARKPDRFSLEEKCHPVPSDTIEFV